MHPSSITSSSLTLEPRVAPRQKLFDALEMFVVLTFYFLLLFASLEAVWLRGDLNAALLALSETFVIVLVVIRRPPKLVSERPADWFLAFGATIVPTLFRPVAVAPSAWTRTAAGIALCGIAFQLSAKCILGRRFGVVAADRGICDRGPYRLVRHPIYLGYLVAQLAFVTVAPSATNLAVFALTYCLMIPRMLAEERLLRQDDQYAAYCNRVRWRLLPGVF